MQGSSAQDFSHTISAEDEGERLDIFLSRRFEACSRSYLKKLIQHGDIRVNGRTVKPGYETRSGDRISLSFPTVPAHEQLAPEPMSLDLLFEDEELLVVNKPPGLVVHPGAGHEEGTLIHGLLAHCPSLALQGAPRRPGIVHRLDQDTSGALVVAKTDYAYLSLIDQFKEHRVEKEYLALVYGTPPRDRGEIRTFLGRHPVDRKKMAVVAEGRGREAVSFWWIEKSWGEVALVRVRIETGRTHQIRVHMSHMHHPVVGDATYGGGKHRAKAVKSKQLQDLLLPVDRQMLHAYHLAFLHPRTREPLSFTAPLPPDFAGLLEALERDVPAHRP